LIEMGALAFREQRYDQAAELFERGLGMVDAQQEPRLLFVGHYNMMLCLTEQGRFDEAMAMLPKVRRLTVESGSRFDLLRLRWTEGDILRGFGHEARAEAAYLEVRKGFIEEGIAYDAAAVSLTLAALYLRQGRHPEIKRLAAEMVPIFQSRDVHQEAIAALLLFRRAVEMENLTQRLIEEVSEVVRRSQGKPAPPPEQPS
jgi:tetratricopeptide (TPR) repeat protein